MKICQELKNLYQLLLNAKKQEKNLLTIASHQPGIVFGEQMQKNKRYGNLLFGEDPKNF